jgi:anti-sigma factor RsiW
MEHRLFEEWLLDDRPLDPTQKRELDAHLRTCSSCASLAEVNLALRSARTAPPAPGFTARFQTRLALQKKAQRKRQMVGALIFVLGGLGLFAWLITPYIQGVELSPATWITELVGYLVFLLTAIQAIAQASSVIYKVIPDLIPPFAWMVMFSALAGFGVLWTVSIWRFTRLPERMQQGVQQ